jgi:hypothetical protein
MSSRAHTIKHPTCQITMVDINKLSDSLITNNSRYLTEIIDFDFTAAIVEELTRKGYFVKVDEEITDELVKLLDEKISKIENDNFQERVQIKDKNLIEGNLSASFNYHFNTKETTLGTKKKYQFTVDLKMNQKFNDSIDAFSFYTVHIRKENSSFKRVVKNAFKEVPQCERIG